MNEPTPGQLKAMAESRQETAKAVLEDQEQRMLKTIFSAAQLKHLDKWIAAQNDPAIDRLDAIRRLVELGLNMKPR